jgi:hypothetical protein
MNPQPGALMKQKSLRAETAIAWPADHIERRLLAKLIPYARNARIHTERQISQIAASMKEWGWTMPLLVDEDDVLIAGHGRVLAAPLLGWTEAPVMVARGWSEAKKRAYRITDNRLTELSTWDEELLGLEFADLRDFDALLDLTGFESATIDDLIAGPQPPESFSEYDENIEVEHECPKCHFRWSGAAHTERKTIANGDATIPRSGNGANRGDPA